MLLTVEKSVVLFARRNGEESRKNVEEEKLGRIRGTRHFLLNLVSWSLTFSKSEMGRVNLALISCRFERVSGAGL